MNNSPLQAFLRDVQILSAVTIMLAYGLVLASSTQAQNIQYEKLKTYNVSMETKLTVPHGRNISNVRVWQALPTPRDWTSGEGRAGATEVSYSPTNAKRINDQKNDSEYLLFETGTPSPGRVYKFKSQYRVRSVLRHPNVAALKLGWGQIPLTPESSPEINSEILDKAHSLRALNSPSAALIEFSKWITKRIAYDAAVSYPYTDVSSAFKHNRGHCGHFASIFTQFCRALHIPVRTVWGLNLTVEDGITGSLVANARADYTNVHTWLEVNLPGLGWTEIEPSLGHKLFKIPEHYIQNNRWFQNYSVWYEENGNWKQPSWRWNRSGYTSEFELSNTIKFEAN